jgi:hypothetical protein
MAEIPPLVDYVSKTLLIDAICEEGLEGLERLKVWKGAYLEGEATCGNAD